MDILEIIKELFKKNIFDKYDIDTIVVFFLYEIRFVLGFWIFMLLLRIIDSLFFNISLNFRYGLYSLKSKRSNHFFAWIMYPFLHANWRHLKNNSIPFLILGSIIKFVGNKELLICTVFILTISTLSIYFLEKRVGATIGISGLVTGYFGFILLNGYINSNFLNVSLSLIMLTFYQRIIYISLTNQEKNSNIGHFSGFISGLLAALILKLYIN